MKLLLKTTFRFSSALRSPIPPDLLKSDPGRQEIERRCSARFKDSAFPQQLFSSFDTFRKDLHLFEKMSQQANDLKRQLKTTIKQGQSSQAQALKAELAVLKQNLSTQELKLKQSKLDTESFLQSVGNAVHPSTPISQDEKENTVLRYYHPRWGGIREAASILDHDEFVKAQFHLPKKEVKSYQTLTQEFGIADLARGQKVSGHRGFFLLTNGLKLALGLAQYGLDFLEGKSFSCYQTPALILQSVLRDSCQLQSIESDMYRFREDELCLIATSEQTLAGYHRGETFEPRQLPKKMAGYSSCFRREAGAHGKDIHGLFRVHQFQKVQQFVVCRPEESEIEMQGMLSNAEEFYQSLGVPYRIVDIVSGELNDAASRKVDLQAWFPGQGRFRQLVSVSNCTDYQSRMLQTRVRQGQGVIYPHMLNGTLVAIQRTLTCLLQHFYCSQLQALVLPAALRPFMRCEVLLPPKN